ncbi:hypothetical protein CROQUDRAFT_651245 [Cronartium quercuum f. sp. fusiforme G11]|uniref:Uncharacterized protein n=1 Tax=Cronartium quercuum f. sp. fusiforme G11 TaxID=708437 RepID=A0A9P6NXN5_9BASI|nr:hypothetical protein CROQUDRAFT_651245 [Cronartium quercuum f. sp. fusiforme G11]
MGAPRVKLVTSRIKSKSVLLHSCRGALVCYIGLVMSYKLTPLSHAYMINPFNLRLPTVNFDLRYPP